MTPLVPRTYAWLERELLAHGFRCDPGEGAWEDPVGKVVSWDCTLRDACRYFPIFTTIFLEILLADQTFSITTDTDEAPITTQIRVGNNNGFWVKKIGPQKWKRLSHLELLAHESE